MKTTLELSYEELGLICRMANKYTQSLEERIALDDELGIPHNFFDKDKKAAFEFWDKIEKIEKEMIRGTK